MSKSKKTVIYVDPPKRYAVLVVKARTGIIYTTQAGGVGCTHPETEGYIAAMIPVPMKSDISKGASKVQIVNCFNPAWYYKNGMGVMNSEVLRDIQTCLNFWNKYGLVHDIRKLKVDMKREFYDWTKEGIFHNYETNTEAWVHVVGEISISPTLRKSKWVKFEGILTWENCD